MTILRSALDLYFLTGLCLGGGLVGLLFWVWWNAREKQLRQEADQAIAYAKREAKLEIEQATSRLELDFERQRDTAERALAEERLHLQQKEDEVLSALMGAEKERDALEKRRASYESMVSSVEAREIELREELRSLRAQIVKVARMSEEEAKSALKDDIRAECEDEIREMRSTLLGRSEREIQRQARDILLAAMQRLAGLPQTDITAAIVRLPSEDMKGRIIGREGRNIKSFEMVTGTTLLIDETPDSVLVSSFDPVRREIARVALEALLKDGRIHPSSIEAAVAEAENEVKQSVIHYGEDALRRLRLSRVNPEVITALGRMHYRLSNNQNLLHHSIEVANLCALMASEVGLDVEIAKRAGLFHDIGKVLDEEHRGSHAAAGASYMKRFGTEPPEVLNAIAAHHGEVEAESAYTPLVIIADSLSAMRPGARAESIDSYIQRVRNLETLAKKHEGVVDAYAIQAGREIRVIVSPESISDDAARALARNIRRQIEDELQYPGTIRVTLIRESRITETAR